MSPIAQHDRPTSESVANPETPPPGPMGAPSCPACKAELSVAARKRGAQPDGPNPNGTGTCEACGATFEWYRLAPYPTPTAKTFRGLGPTAVLGAVWTASPAILGGLLVAYLPWVADQLNALGPWAWPTYVALFIVSAGVGFLPTYGQSILGGWAFGFALGFPGAMLGFVGGSVIGYFIAKGVSREKVRQVLDANPKARAVRNALIGRGFWHTTGIVTLIRVPPNSPFALTNLVLASSGVRLLPYMIGTAIGMAPRTGIAVFIAAAAHVEGATSIKDVLEQREWWVWALGVGTVAVVVAILAWLGNRAIARVTGNGGK